MKYKISIAFLLMVSIVFSQTPITDDNFHQAIDTCLATNPVDGLCYSCEYGAMPDWDVSNVTDMSNAFKNRYGFNSNISNWDVSNVTTMESMFEYASNFFHFSLEDWDVSNVTNMSNMFRRAYRFNQLIGSWDVSSVTNMSGMFSVASSFNQDLSNWDVSSVTDMSHMFTLATYFNGDITNWDVSKVTDMSYMFKGDWLSGPNAFNQDIGDWDVGSVTSMSNMFNQAEEFNQDIGDWDVSNVIDMTRMFYDCDIFNQDLSNWCVEQIPVEPEKFSEYSPLIPEYHPHWGEECFVGINNTELENLIVYPNPTKSIINIDKEPSEIYEIIIYNQFNQLLFKTNNKERIVDISNFQSGIYILEIITSDHGIRKKVIKE